MALVHVNATISPSKLEVAHQWLAATDWFDGDLSTLKLGTRYSYRFDDPAGEVGVEVLLVADGDRVLQVPLTYRSAELPGASSHLVTHMDHSVLGRRWIYDGLGDPVFVNTLVRAALNGAQQEDFEVEVDGQLQVFPAIVRVRGTGSGPGSSPATAPGGAIGDIERVGSTSRVHTDAGVLVLPHVAGDVELADGPGLIGSWPGSEGEIPLAAVEPGPGYR